jgi:predicted transcriptional regulator
MSFEPSTILSSATQIISAHLGNNNVAFSDVPTFIKKVYETLTDLESAASIDESAGHHSVNGTDQPKPAVPVNESVFHDYIICLEDGKRLRMLKRYIMTQFGITPQEYRNKWGLAPDYPMAAPAVAEQRRESARALGLGLGLGRVPRKVNSRRARR